MTPSARRAAGPGEIKGAGRAPPLAIFFKPVLLQPRGRRRKKPVGETKTIGGSGMSHSKKEGRLGRGRGLQNFRTRRARRARKKGVEYGEATRSAERGWGTIVLRKEERQYHGIQVGSLRTALQEKKNLHTMRQRAKKHHKRTETLQLSEQHPGQSRKSEKERNLTDGAEKGSLTGEGVPKIKGLGKKKFHW